MRRKERQGRKKEEKKNTPEQLLKKENIIMTLRQMIRQHRSECHNTKITNRVKDKNEEEENR